MDKAQLERKVARRRFTLSAKKLDELLSQEGKTDICAEFDKISKLYDDLSVIQNKILNFWLDDEHRDEKLLEQDIDSSDCYDSQWYTLKQRVKEAIEILPASKNSYKKTVEQDSSSSDGEHKNKEKRRLRLPKLELTKFNGEIHSWLAFWSQFKKIDGDTKIDLEDKFQYLLQCMEHGTSARELVNSFPPSAENYPKVVIQLKQRFAREELLIEHYVRELLQLVSKQAKGVPNYSIRSLYDKLMTQILALESLGVTQDKYAAFLYPMVESALPDDVIRAWNRSHLQADDKQSQLSKLLNFVMREVESDERIHLARSGFPKRDYVTTSSTNPSAACFTTMTRDKSNSKGIVQKTQDRGDIVEKTCLWCGKHFHNSSECTMAVKMTLDERKDFIKQKNACYICLKPGHNAKKCRKYPKCVICDSRHYPIMCSNLMKYSTTSNGNGNSSNTKKNQEAILNQTSSMSVNTVLLQTLKVNIIKEGEVLTVRALLDSGAQRSFIKSDVVEKLKIEPNGEQQISYSLFGGVVTKKENQKQYTITVRSLDSNYQINIEALEQKTICGYLPRVRQGKLLSLLQGKGYILTGRSVHVDDNLLATETKLGWTVQGPAVNVYSSSVNNVSTVACSFDVDDLWKLETIGIKDEAEIKNQKVVESEVKDFFNSTIKINEEDRYEVKLPWKDTNEFLPTNYNIAIKRLKTTTCKLTSLGILSDYNEVFEDWLSSNIIEEVKMDDTSRGHYMPHHAVVKESSLTTKIRPVFDASAAVKGGCSLNNCLDKGVNLIEQIPRLLINFRRGAIGIIADIKKAFLQISLHSEDRDYLKFLWWQDINRPGEKIKTFRHRRVVFGVTSSPFLLSATILYHLNKFDNDTATKLKKSFYVDNCVISTNSTEEMHKFIEEAKDIMNKGKFELRCWVTGPIITDEEVQTTSVLGLIWDPRKDELYCKVPFAESNIGDQLTKRTLLSIAQSIFDPIGFTCPTTLIPKLIIQKCWMTNISWDTQLPSELEKSIREWLKQIRLLEDCRIPRCISKSNLQLSYNTLHIFSNASQSAYATCIFLRSELDGVVNVQLISAKSRVCPIKQVTMPRLELLAALLSARLSTEVKEGLELKCEEYYWTDSSIVLAWIKRKVGLNVFVHNRVTEIIRRTNVDNWHHIPGELNPADLPSRGCNAQFLLNSRWWEGPSWLKGSSINWPNSKPEPNEEEFNREIKKSFLVVQDVETFSDGLTYFGKYTKIVRMVGWCIRFINNCQNVASKTKGNLSAEEYMNAEKKIFVIIQKEHYSDDVINELKIKIFKDEDGLFRVKTRLTLSKDSEDFINPILLPAKNNIIQRLVSQKHIQDLHSGSQTLINRLRENYWIVGVRRLAKKIVHQCIRCRRYSAKACTVPPAPLPLNRIHCGTPFEVTGIDLAGPLYLKSGEKCWTVLFTCATYRAVHLDITMSLSTEEFILTLRRFLARRKGVKVIYSDNGTNFRGTYNLLSTVNWKEIADRIHIQKIQWRFIPPLAPWWGGFWERMIRVLKDILRRTLGKASLNQTEMYTVLCEVETILNARPLTYIAENTENFIPLTPAMFLHVDLPNNSSDVTDLDYIDEKRLTARLRYIRKLTDELKDRFRSEYLSLLTEKISKNKFSAIKVGDIVLIGFDNVKRLNWPLGLVLEIYTGVDGSGRVARVKTANGERIRPLQRLYSLEISTSNGTALESVVGDDSIQCDDSTSTVPSAISNMQGQRVTRTGRLVKVPCKLDL